MTHKPNQRHATLGTDYVMTYHEPYLHEHATPAQSRTARGLLEWSQIELGARSNLSEGAVRDFEKGRRPLSPKSLLTIRYAFEDAGVEFTNRIAPGVKLCPRKGFQ